MKSFQKEIDDMLMDLFHVGCGGRKGHCGMCAQIDVLMQVEKMHKAASRGFTAELTKRQKELALMDKEKRGLILSIAAEYQTIERVKKLKRKWLG